MDAIWQELTNGMRSKSDEDAYEWLINEFLPEKGPDHMGAFLDVGMVPYNYFAWLLAQVTPKPHLREAIIDRITEVFGECPPFPETE